MFYTVKKVYIGVSYVSKDYGSVYVFFEKEEEIYPYYRCNDYFNIYQDVHGEEFLEDITDNYIYYEDIGEANKKIMDWTLSDNF